MRKLSWEPELARLAEMWAAQCSSQHEAVRRVIINGEELDVRTVMQSLSHSSVSVRTEFDCLQRKERLGCWGGEYEGDGEVLVQRADQPPPRLHLLLHLSV